MKIFKSKTLLSLPFSSNQLKLKVVPKGTYFILDEEFYEENKTVNHDFKFETEDFSSTISQEFMDENLEHFEEVSITEYMNWKLNFDLNKMLNSFLRERYEFLSSINPHYDSFEIWKEKILKEFMKLNYKEELTLAEQIFKQPKVKDFYPQKNPFEFKCIKCNRGNNSNEKFDFYSCQNWDCPYNVQFTTSPFNKKI